MCLRILSVCVALILAQSSRAEDYPELADLPAPQQPNATIDRPKAYAASDANMPAAGNSLLEGVTPEKQILIQQKLREIDRLEAEIEQIRNEAGVKQQILLQFLVLEVSLDELEKIDFHWPGLHREMVADKVAALQSEIERVHLDNRKSQVPLADDQLGFLSCLAGAKFAKVLADPKLVVLNRRSATFSAENGPEVAEGDGKGGFRIVKCGTVFDVTPTEVSPSVVRLGLRVKNIEPLDSPYLVKVANSTQSMGSLRMVAGTIEAEYGKPFLLDGIPGIKVASKSVDGATSLTTTRQMMVVGLLAERVGDGSIVRKSQ